MTAPLPRTKHPARLLLDITPRCNLKCAMCPRSLPEGPWKGEDLGEAAVPRFLKLLRDSAHAKPLVQAALYGEPLLIPGFRDFITETRKLGLSVAINTNGVLADETMCQLLVDTPLDSAFFSLDAVEPATYKAIRGVDKLAAIGESVMTLLRLRASAALPRIGVSFTRQEENLAEEKPFVAYWTRHVDVVRANALISQSGHDTHLFRPLPKNRIPCRMLYETMPVFHDGEAAICCQDHRCRFKMGNVFETSVEEVWTGGKFEEYRRLHERGEWDKIPICASCDRWAQFQYDEERKDGLIIRTSPQMRYYNRADRLAGWEGALRGGHEPIDT